MNVFDQITPYIKIGLMQSLYVIHDNDWFEKKIKTEYTLWNICKGNVYLKINKHLYKLSAGDVAIFRPGMTYTATTDENGCEFLYHHFSLEMGNKIDILCNINIAGIIKEKHIPNLCLSYCNRIKDVYTDRMKNSLHAYSEFLTYFSDITDIIASNKLIKFFEASTDVPKNRMWRVMSYIGANFTKNLSVKELADFAGLSEKHFIVQFHQTLGLAPKQYLIRCRMTKASELLKTTDLKISDIAERTGYGDVYSFSRAFKKYCNESPSEYRKHFMR